MRVLVDFNSETADGRFFTLLQPLDAVVARGDLVEAYDADGDVMVVTVDDVDQARGLVYLRPEWSTWRDGEGAPEAICLVAGADIQLSGNFLAAGSALDNASDLFIDSLAVA